MTTQEAYERIHTYFSREGAVLAVDPDWGGPINGEGNGCRYRTAEGNGCAVGCLIPDELYDPRFENKGIEDVIAMNEKIEALFGNLDLDFLSAAQDAHDSAGMAHATVAQFLDELNDIAEGFELEVVA